MSNTPNVRISGDAVRALSHHVRVWSGQTKATLVFGEPKGSPYASYHRTDQRFTANPDTLVLNPNRVLNTVTPFRLKQEAVLTGALLHEAAHARFSTWMPKTEEEARDWKHPDGKSVTPQEVALARLVEEPRIEGLMIKSSGTYGFPGLGWTMRASAAHLIPITPAATDPDREIMDVMQSWILRAGRQYAYHNGGAIRRIPNWVRVFDDLLKLVITNHLAEATPKSSDPISSIMSRLHSMITWTGGGSQNTPVVLAREILEILFPETEPEDMPVFGSGCAMGDEEESDESGESGASGSTGQSDDQSDESGEGDKGDDGSDDGESDGSDGSGSGDGDSDDNSDEGSNEGDEESTLNLVRMRLRDVEETSRQQEAEDSKEAGKTEGAPELTPGGLGSDADPTLGKWRVPTKDERDSQREAERFLRGLIDPSDSATVSLTDTPSATVDGAALSAWKAGGQARSPHFFQRSQREVEPTPPVKVAILVDVSGSMDVLQKPSALLSWALANACLDLRNFAGRGQQVESCLIHWGEEAQVIQKNGKTMPGILDAPCIQGTTAMGDALRLAEQELPGFFDITETPVNRLLVQFTDWELHPFHVRETTEVLSRALGSGVNMLTVAPSAYSNRWSTLPNILRDIAVQRGFSKTIKYNPNRPDDVWAEASRMLAQPDHRPAPFLGF